MSVTKDSVDVLFVCSANVCRSVIGAHAFERALTSVDPFRGIRVESRGVDVRGVLEACHRANEVLPEPDIQERLAAHRSRALKPGTIARSTLILAASREVRSAIVGMGPGARRKVFTVREALWLANDFSAPDSQEPQAIVQAFAEHLDAHRGLRPVPEPSRRWIKHTNHPLDIVDGHVLGGRAHKDTVVTVARLSTELAAILAGADPKKNLSTRGMFRT